MLYAGQFVAGFGTAMTYVVLPLQMYRLTRSTLSVGLLGVVEFVPMFLLAFVGGALADHFDRRRLIVMVECLMAACCAMLAWNAMLPAPHVEVLWAAAGLLAGLTALHRPAMEALTPQVVGSAHMPAVGALNSVRGNFAHIAGPGLAGIIAASAGVGAAFAVNAATYAFSVAMILLMRPLPRVSLGEDGITLHALLEGWRYARRRQDLLGTYLIDMNAMFFGMPNALFPAISEQWGASTVGWLYAAPAVGAIVASIGSGWTSRVHRHGFAIAWAAALWGVAIVAFGLSTELWMALLFLALAGAADNISGIFRMTIWNQTIPTRLRGRTAAIEMVSYLSGPYLGNAEAGLAARLFGLRASVVSGGVLCVLGSVALSMLLPAFIKYDSREGIRRRQEEESRAAAS